MRKRSCDYLISTLFLPPWQGNSTSFLSRDHFLINLLPSGELLSPTFRVEVCVHLLWAPHLPFFAWLVILELDPVNTPPVLAGHGANLCSLGCWRDVAGESISWLVLPFHPAPGRSCPAQDTWGHSAQWGKRACSSWYMPHLRVQTLSICFLNKFPHWKPRLQSMSLFTLAPFPLPLYRQTWESAHLHFLLPLFWLTLEPTPAWSLSPPLSKTALVTADLRGAKTVDKFLSHIRKALSHTQHSCPLPPFWKVLSWLHNTIPFFCFPFNFPLSP